MTRMTRRGFLGTAAVASAALVIGMRADGSWAAGSGAQTFNPFVRIDADGKVTAIIKHFEMGQGTSTGLTTLIAEELGVTMDQIGFDYAPADASVYNNLFFGPMQGTGGSTAMANSFQQYRQAGAAARQMLIAAAAEAWGVEAQTLDIQDGSIVGGDKPAPIGAFVAAAMQKEAPAEPALRDPSTWKLIGNPSIGRVDNFNKVNGTGQFAMDVHLDNQMVVALARTPRFGGTVKGFDDSAAKDITGFIRAEVMPTKSAVAVFAEGTWAAFQARDALVIDWDFSAAETRSSDQIREELIAAINAAPEFTVAGDAGAADAALAGAVTVVEQTFYFPLLAHAPMEPETCTIAATEDGGAILYDGAQFPTLGQGAMAQVLGLPPEKCQIKTLYAGGSFGRRANPNADYNAECAMAFALTDRTRPVKLVWSREDDIRGGYYRPAFVHKVRAGLDTNGVIIGWEHRIAGQSIMKGTAFEAFAVKDGVDGSSVEGVADSPYAIPGLSVGLTDTKKATNVLWWRSVGHTHTAYVMESMMDMLAAAAGKDPVAFRLDYLSGDGKDAQRLAGVLKLAAEKSGWETPAPEGHRRGIAVHKSFSSYVAEVVEISGDAESGIQIEKVTCAVDCGVPVNPDVIVAQMQGGAGFGLGAVMRNEITLSDGEVDQSNFPDYEPLRIGDIKAIEVHIIPSNEAPTGIGEPGTPPAGPALANAIAQNGGPRITELPMSHMVAFK